MHIPSKKKKKKRKKIKTIEKIFFLLPSERSAVIMFREASLGSQDLIL